MIRWAIKHSLYVVALGFGAMVAWAAFRPAVEGSGNPATEERDIGDVTELSLSGIGDVTLVQGAVPSVRVTADDNILPYLVTETSGKRLNIRTQGGSIRPKTKIAYTVTVPRLDAITISGAGNVKTEKFATDALTVKLSGAGNANLRDLTCKSLSLTLSGAGKANLSGTAERATVRLSGAGNIDAEALKTNTADVQISGAGKASMWATDSLKVHVSGAGGVKYKGTPQLEQKVSGAGSVRPLQ